MLMCAEQLSVSTRSDTHTVFCSENPISPLSHLPITGPSRLPKTHNTHTHKYCPFFLRCVCTRLLGHKSFSGMDECLQPIHHPPYPPPSPLFLYQPAVTLTTDGPSSPPSFLFFPTSLFCAISLFSRSPVLTLLVGLTLCMLVGVHARFPTSPPHLPVSSSSLHVPRHLSISLLCTIGTGVAPSERPVKRPYKKPQHVEERVMMKFNCSSWCTCGLALYMCAQIYEHVRVVFVFVCVQRA